MIQRYVNISFVLIGILAWAIAAALLGLIIDWINPDWNISLIGARFALADLLGLAIGAGVGIGLRLSARINELALEIGNELKKVTWPTWKETQIATLVVLIVTAVVALILGLFDMMWSWATGFIYDTGRVFTFFSFLGLAVIVGGTALLFYYSSRD